jgi:WD40 repeat protein
MAKATRGLLFSALLVAGLLLDCPPVKGQNATPLPQLVVPQPHSKPINAIAAAPDGKWFATGGGDQTIKIWSWPETFLLRTISTGNSVGALAVDPNGRVVVSGDDKGNLQFWNTATGEAEGVLVKTEGFIDNAAFSPNGRLLAVTALGAVHVFDAASRKEIWRSEPSVQTLRLHQGQQLAFAQDNKFVFTTNIGEGLMIWDALTGAPVKSLSESGKTWVSLVVSPSGKYLAAGSAEGSVQIWSTPDWNTQETTIKCPRWSGALFFGLDDSVLHVACNVDPADMFADGTMQTWDWRQGVMVSAFRFEPDAALPFSSFDGIARTPDGTHAIAGVLRDFRVWDLASHSLVRGTKGHAAGEISATFTPSSGPASNGAGPEELVASADTYLPPRIWRIGEDIRSRTLPSPELDDDYLDKGSRYIRNGEWMAVLMEGKVGGEWKFCVRIWDTRTGAAVASIDGTGMVEELAASPDGARVAWLLQGEHPPSEKDTLVVWNVAKNKIEARLPVSSDPSQVTLSIEFSADGRVLAAGAGDGTVHLFSEPTWTERVLDPHMTNVYRSADSVVFLGGGAKIISGHADGTLRSWDLNNLAPAHVVQAGVSQIRRLALSHDGNTLVSASEDHEIRLWQVGSTGTLVPEGIPSHSEAGISSLAFNSKDDMLAIGAEDSTISVWKLPAKVLVVSLYLDPAPGSKRWFSWTRTGYFDGGDDGWEEALWRFQDNTFLWTPLAAHFGDFFYRGLVAAVLSGQPIPAPPKLAPSVQPTVALSVSQLWAPNQSTAEIQIQVTSPRRDLEVRDLRLFRNGVLVRKWPGKLAMNAHGATLFTAEVGLTAGENVLKRENVFTAYAFNSSNVASSTAELILRADRSIERAPSMRILSVGIDHYAAPGMDLKYAVADATLLVQSIEEQQRKNWRFLPVVPKTLYNADATKARILAELRALAAASRPQDSVVIFFASHGFASKNGGRFYLLPTDVLIGNPTNSDSEKWTASAISDRELEEALRPLDATHIMLIIDSCRSGQVLNSSEERRRGPLNASGLAQLAYEKGISILTASQAYQDAIEVHQFGHGLLTHVLVEEGLGQFLADREPKDGEISWTEWIHYAIDRVPELQSTGTGKRGVISLSGPTVGQRPGWFVRSEAENDKIRWNTMDRMGSPISLESLPQGVPNLKGAPSGPVSVLVFLTDLPFMVDLGSNLQQILDKPKHPNMQVFGITVVAPEEIAQLRKDNHWTFPVFRDKPPNRAFMQMGVCDPNCLIPYTFVLRPDGTVYARIWGYRSAELLEAAIRGAAASQ